MIFPSRTHRTQVVRIPPVAGLNLRAEFRRQLEDHARRRRGDLKTHEPEVRGRIVRLFPEEGYGFIERSDGTECYFHRAGIAHPDFDRLQVGDEVVFLEEPAGEGLQANRVSVRKP